MPENTAYDSAKNEGEPLLANRASFHAHLDAEIKGKAYSKRELHVLYIR
ncbi:unnamed protein product, partial [marine sediment metagenome]